jgi:hypothetical protein
MQPRTRNHFSFPPETRAPTRHTIPITLPGANVHIGIPGAYYVEERAQGQFPAWANQRQSVQQQQRSNSEGELLSSEDEESRPSTPPPPSNLEQAAAVHATFNAARAQVRDAPCQTTSQRPQHAQGPLRAWLSRFEIRGNRQGRNLRVGRNNNASSLPDRGYRSYNEDDLLDEGILSRSAELFRIPTPPPSSSRLIRGPWHGRSRRDGHTTHFVSSSLGDAPSHRDEFHHSNIEDGGESTQSRATIAMAAWSSSVLSAPWSEQGIASSERDNTGVIGHHVDDTTITRPTPMSIVLHPPTTTTIIDAECSRPAALNSCSKRDLTPDPPIPLIVFTTQPINDTVHTENVTLHHSQRRDPRIGEVLEIFPDANLDRVRELLLEHQLVPVIMMLAAERSSTAATVAVPTEPAASALIMPPSLTRGSRGGGAEDDSGACTSFHHDLINPWTGEVGEARSPLTAAFPNARNFYQLQDQLFAEHHDHQSEQRMRQIDRTRSPPVVLAATLAAGDNNQIMDDAGARGIVFADDSSLNNPPHDPAPSFFHHQCAPALADEQEEHVLHNNFPDEAATSVYHLQDILLRGNRQFGPTCRARGADARPKSNIVINHQRNNMSPPPRRMSPPAVPLSTAAHRELHNRSLDDDEDEDAIRTMTATTVKSTSLYQDQLILSEVLEIFPDANIHRIQELLLSEKRLESIIAAILADDDDDEASSRMLPSSPFRHGPKQEQQELSAVVPSLLPPTQLRRTVARATALAEINELNPRGGTIVQTPDDIERALRNYATKNGVTIV